MRVPVTGYSLDIGKAHTDFAEAKLQQRLVERKLSDEEINQLAVVAMAGATAEAMNYEEVGLATCSTHNQAPCRLCCYSTSFTFLLLHRYKAKLLT